MTHGRDTHPSAATGPYSLTGKRAHFVGIGGSGMSGLARLVRAGGATCSGSDLAESPIIEALRDDGFEIRLEQTAESLPDACDLLVISAAIKPDHPEVQAATRRGVEVVKYAALLGRLMRGRRGIAISGTHGKSSTTSMLAHVLIESGLDPSVIVGANCPQIGGGWRVGRSDLLLAEACEYDRSFHHFHPTHAAVLNIEEDHLDLYANLDEIVESFAHFASLVPAEGSLLIRHESPHRLTVAGGLDCPVETIGFAPLADWQIEMDDHGQVQLSQFGDPVARWRNPLPGEHMAYNAAVAAVLAHRVGATWEQITPAIEGFEGLNRRMQRLGVLPRDGGEILVIDDYGHHPTEVDTTLRALRRHHDPKRLICVFQPHQHSRTRFLLEAFAMSFEAADAVIVPHIYFVRDSKKEQQAVHAADLVDRLRQRGRQAMHLYPFEAIVEQLEMMLQPGDLLVTMGAGDVWKVADQLLGRHQANA